MRPRWLQDDGLRASNLLDLSRFEPFSIVSKSLKAKNWAADYENVCLQHNVAANPATLLALAPAIFEKAPEMALWT